MSFFQFLNNKCVICKRKKSPLRKYMDDGGRIIKVCIPCSEYAERRAYRRIK